MHSICLLCFLVTECEIQDGILKAADVDSHVLVYRRQLNVLDESALSEENMSRYIDVRTDGEVCAVIFSSLYIFM